MSDSTLAMIRKKIRRLTNTPDPLQLPNNEIDEYVDTFYEQDMPAHVKLFSLKSVYTFYTVANEDQYILPVNVIGSVQPPLYVAGYQAAYHQDRTQFFRYWPTFNNDEDGINGDGTAGPYSFTLNQSPVLRRNYSVSAVDSNDDTVTLADDGDGNLTFPDDTFVRGTIDYVTGSVTVTDFGNTIPASSTINSQYASYSASRPLAALFFQNVFTLRPVPDKSYRVDINVFHRPSQLLESATDEPDLQQWWQFIAIGAAMKVLEDRQDLEGRNEIMRLFDEQLQLVLHRTAVQQANQRSATIYDSSNLTDCGYNHQLGYW